MLDDERGTTDDRRGATEGESAYPGPWLLTLGVGVVGVAALTREVLRGGETDETA